MAKDIMNQGDIFLCINKLFAVTYETIAFNLQEIDGASGIDKSRVNRTARQKAKGFCALADKHGEIYNLFFAEHVKHDPEYIFFNIKNFIAQKNLINPADNLKYNSCEEYIKQVIKYALLNWNTCREPERVTKNNLQNQIFADSKFFIGRDNLLAELKDILISKHIAVLKGMAGIGKSSLARRYAMLNSKNYQTVQFISPHPPLQLKQLII